MPIALITTVSIAALAGAYMGYSIRDSRVTRPRFIQIYERISKKMFPKMHTGFHLQGEELVLYSRRDGEPVKQNYFLLDEPDGIKFNVRCEYLVEIKMKKLNNSFATKSTEIKPF
jgi:hypothetical protein